MLSSPERFATQSEPTVVTSIGPGWSMTASNGRRAHGRAGVAGRDVGLKSFMSELREEPLLAGLTQQELDTLQDLLHRAIARTDAPPP